MNFRLECEEADEEPILNIGLINLRTERPHCHCRPSYSEHCSWPEVNEPDLINECVVPATLRTQHLWLRVVVIDRPT